MYWFEILFSILCEIMIKIINTIKNITNNKNQLLCKPSLKK